MDTKYAKLSELVGSTFTIKSVGGYKFRMWSQPDGRYVLSDTYMDGFSKIYETETDKGQLTLSHSQLGQCLEAVSRNGKADLIGATIQVKSNGKIGQEIRYYLNLGSQSPSNPSPDLSETQAPKEAEGQYGTDVNGLAVSKALKEKLQAQKAEPEEDIPF